MPISISWLTKAQNAYIDLIHLRENYPYPDQDLLRGKYEAREKLITLCDEALNLANEAKVDNYSPARLLCILFNHDIGIIEQEIGELESAQEYLNKAKDFCNEWYSDDPLLVLLRISILNQLAYVHTLKPDFKKGLALLDEAHSDYEKWIEFKKTITSKGAKGREPRTLIEIMECFSSKIDQKLQKPEAENEVEKAHAKTLYHMAQVYEKIGDSEKSANCWFRTLKKQIILNYFKTTEWCINVATLAQYFAGLHRFAVASHLLRASRYMLDFRPRVRDEKLVEDNNTLLKGFGDYHCIMVKYYILLLKYSLSKEENKFEEEAQKIEEFRFIHEEELEKKKVDHVRYRLITNFKEASTVFQSAKKDFEVIESYYYLDEQGAEYISCAQDLSKLYRLVAEFTDDIDIKCKIDKRRADLLENALKKIDLRMLMAECRLVYFELGEIYYEMHEYKANKERDYTGPILKKLNTLLTKSGDAYKTFIQTFLNAIKGEERPAKVTDDLVKPLVLSYFNIGRTLSKKFYVDPNEKIKQWSNCLKYYELATDYIDSNPGQKALVEEEVKLILQQKELISQKMAEMLATNVIR